MQLTTANAKKLGLKVPGRKGRKGQKQVVIGTGTITAKAPGSVTVRITFTKAVKTALAKAAGKRSKLTVVSGTARFTLTKTGLKTVTVNKPLTFKKR